MDKHLANIGLTHLILPLLASDFNLSMYKDHMLHITDSERSVINCHGEESYVDQTEILLIGNFNIPLQHIYSAGVS
jgi:hypothetical protein